MRRPRQVFVTFDPAGNANAVASARADLDGAWVHLAPCDRPDKATRYVLPPKPGAVSARSLAQEARWWREKYVRLAKGIERIRGVRQRPTRRTSWDVDTLLGLVAGRRRGRARA